jgi:hypothetical protein
VARLHDEHLTTEQLSASFDNQLPPQEQAVFDAHISTCQQCQGNLADLRLTVALLHALPEEEVPRPFVLPSRMTTVPQRQHKQLSTLRRTIRVVSTLAAVLALFFIISGILPLMNVAGGSSTSTATSNSTFGGVHSTVTTPGNHVTTNARPQEGAAATTPPTQVPTQKLSPTDTTRSKASDGTQPTNQRPSIPPVLDPGQSAGRLSLGVLLLILSIIGLIITRRKRASLNS